MALNMIDHTIFQNQPILHEYYGCSIELLEKGGENILENTNDHGKETKFTFTMTRDVFERVITHFDEIGQSSSYREIFYNETDEDFKYLENNIWIKKIQKFDGLQVVDESISIKYPIEREQHLSDKGLEFLQCKLSVEEARRALKGLDKVMQHGINYQFDILRREFSHKNKHSVKLIMDEILFEDGESIMIFSLRGATPIEKNINSDLETLPACRSKIIELVSRKNTSLYNHLVNTKKICCVKYESISTTEFKYGKDIADKRRVQAQQFKQKSIEAGEEEWFINMMFGQILKNGIDTDLNLVQFES